MACLFCVVIGLLCMTKCTKDDKDSMENFDMTQDDKDNTENFVLMQFEQTNDVIVNQNNTTVGTVSRNIPTEVKNEGISTKYPTYGTNMTFSEEEREKLYEESTALFASFDSMDSQGNLLLNGVETGKKLYKHTVAENIYFGQVSDDEDAVKEQITICSNEVRNFLTGLYAPAGEVVKVEISSQDLESIGALNIAVGQVTHRNIVHTIPKTKTSYGRMPTIAKVFKQKTTEFYVGNYFGGPIYISPDKYGKEFTVTISGAVKYPCFIYGKTTKEEFEQTKTSSAPYFDFEVWNLGVRHSGTAKYANFDYDNLQKVGDFWEKVCQASRQVPNTSNKYIGVGFIYDPYVAAGSACAYQGGNTWVNAPYYTFGNALNYDNIVQYGIWGMVHEFNHHYQNYGIAPYGEVTNNATSLLSYILYTDISSFRSENDSTLTGWNRYTDPTRSLKETISNAKNTAPQSTLNIYADIIHNFGTDKFVKAAMLSSGKHDVDSWFLALTNATGYDMTYYFENLLHQTVSDEAKAEVPVGSETFVPVACLYQVGRYILDGQGTSFVNTVRPYKIEYGKEYVLDFEKFLIVPDDFDVEIVSITNPQNGTLQKQTNKKYIYTPSKDVASGEFEITIKLTHDTIQTKPITLVLNLAQKEPTITAKKYIYNSRVYNKADDAIANNFAQFSSVQEKMTTSTFLNGVANNQIGVVEGKIYIPQDGQYTFCLRAGRGNNALYISKDGITFDKMIEFDGNKGGFEIEESHNCTLQLEKGKHIWFRQVVISNGHSDAFTELGWTTNQSTPVTIPAKYLFNVEREYTPYTFVTTNRYPRQNNLTKSVYNSDISKWEILSCNMSQWDDTTKIENILQNSTQTFYHNNRNNFVSSGNPFELLIDTHQQNIFNALAFYARETGKENLPCTFELFGGVDKDNLTLLGTYTNQNIVDKKISVTFEKSTIRYFKLVVTDTKSSAGGNKYVSFAKIELGYNFEGKLCSPDKLLYYKTMLKSFSHQTNCNATFGHLVSGNGQIKFTFDGTQIALFTNQKTECTLKIDIDGTQTQIKISKQNQKDIGFISDVLENKSHNLTITLVDGVLDLDSVAIAKGK